MIFITIILRTSFLVHQETKESYYFVTAMWVIEKYPPLRQSGHSFCLHVWLPGLSSFSIFRYNVYHGRLVWELNEISNVELWGHSRYSKLLVPLTLYP